MGTLPADRKATTMAEAAVAAQIHQSLDAQRHVAAEVALDAIVVCNDLAEAHHFLVTQKVGARRRDDLSLLTDLESCGATNAIDIGQGDPNLLPSRKIDACNACHEPLPLTLLVARIDADHTDNATPLDDLALLTHLLDRSPDLHGFLPCSSAAVARVVSVHDPASSGVGATVDV
jgi:hypothetical protein